MDLKAIEDAYIDNLSPKKTQELLQCIEDLRAKLIGKDSADTGKEGTNTTEASNNSQGGKGNPENNGTVPVQEILKVQNVWENFDITRLRNAEEKRIYHQPGMKDGVAMGK
ncbi:hypothetical protein RIF29_29812 [Crotalaria pallida]|uniref:Uncharacterized protein n=1 Tax=Crotalaria pallida TaxID=3830 RepID=A0AAN9EHC6_CROPI